MSESPVDVIKDLILLQNCLPIRLSNKLTIYVSIAMYPIMTIVAKGNDIGKIKSHLRIPSPRLNMVCLNTSITLLCSSASHTPIAISLIDLSYDRPPFTGGINPLSFRGTTINKVWVCLTSPPIHTVVFAHQIWFRLGCFLRKNASRIFVVFFSSKWIYITFLRPAIVLPMKIFSALSCFNSKISYPFVNPLGISMNNFCNVVCRKFFDYVFLIKPILIHRFLSRLPFRFAGNRTKLCNPLSTPDDLFSTNYAN